MARHSQIRLSQEPEFLQPIAPTVSDSATWEGATWVGEIDQADLAGERLSLFYGTAFRRARLLVWAKDQPRGFVEVAVHDGSIDLAEVRDKAAQFPDVPFQPTLIEWPPISLVVCTRDRPALLRDLLDSLAALDYPKLEVLIIDNDPESGLTRTVVESFDTMPIRMVEAVGQGLAIARNVAIKNAAHNVIAFTDDDVVLDRRWLKNLARGFARNERVACVCGMVPACELVTPAQSYFDRRVSWAGRCEPAVYDRDTQTEDDPLFPLHVSQFGTGANFALRKDVAIKLGGFDEALGIGSPAGAGEDVDMFVRIVLAGYILVREPSAVVWHRHRRSADELATQVYNYGLGLGAWSLKLLMRPRTFGMVVRRLIPGIRHLRKVTDVDHDDAVHDAPGLSGLDRHEREGVRRGPMALLRGRISGRRAAPLKPSSAKALRIFDFRRDQMWGEQGNSIVAGRLSVLAIAIGLVGSLGAIRALPMFVLVIVVAAFMLAGPGSLILSWYPHLPPFALVALIPTVSLATCILAVTALLLIGAYNPVLVLMSLTVATVVGGLVRCGYLAHRLKATR